MLQRLRPSWRTSSRTLLPRSGPEELTAVDEDEHFPLPRELRELSRNGEALLGAAAVAPTAEPAPVPTLDGRDLEAVSVLAALG